MPKAITATELRTDVYRILDRVLETGQSQEVVRKGQKILLVPAGHKRLSLEDLTKRDLLNCSLDELVATSWQDEWQPDS